MQSITRSECPKELEPADKRAQVRVNLIRRDENYPVSAYSVPSLIPVKCLRFMLYCIFLTVSINLCR